MHRTTSTSAATFGLLCALLLLADCATALWPATWYATDEATFAPGTTALQILCEQSSSTCTQGTGGLLGDINHDGRPDMAFADPYYAARGFTGRVYVVFGQPPSHAWPAQLRLAAIASDPLLGFVVDAATGAWPAGDVNGDGIDDFAVRVNAGANAGKNLYVSGHVGNWSTVDAATATGVLADSTWTTGDFDGDGRADWVSTVQRSAALAGVAWGYVWYYPVLFGSQVPVPPADSDVMALCDGVRGTAVVDGAHLTTALGFTSFQFTPVLVGDINGDACDDAVFTDTNYDGGRGVAAVLLGHRGPWENVTVLAPQSTHMVRGVFESDHCGSAAPVGDVNGDSLGDLLLSCSSALVGYSYLLFGSSSAWAAGANTSLGAIESGSPLGVMLSAKDTVAALGDVNADGCDDMALGTTIVFGRRSGSWQRLTNTSADGTHAVAVANTNSGQLIRAGDINGDGADDIVLLSYSIIGLGRLPSSDFPPYRMAASLGSVTLWPWAPSYTLWSLPTSFRDPEGQALTLVVDVAGSQQLQGALWFNAATLQLSANITRSDQCGTWNLSVSAQDPQGHRSMPLSGTLQIECNGCWYWTSGAQACNSSACKWCRLQSLCTDVATACAECGHYDQSCTGAPSACIACSGGSQGSTFCGERGTCAAAKTTAPDCHVVSAGACASTGSCRLCSASGLTLCVNATEACSGALSCQQRLTPAVCVSPCAWACGACQSPGAACTGSSGHSNVPAIVGISVGSALLLVVVGATVGACVRCGCCRAKGGKTRRGSLAAAGAVAQQHPVAPPPQPLQLPQCSLETEPQQTLHQTSPSTGEVPEVLTEPVHRELCLHEQPECRFTELGGKELKEFQRGLPAHFQMAHEEYVVRRIKAGLAPLMFAATRVWRVENAALERWYGLRKGYMRGGLGRSEEETEDRAAFHGTRPEAVESICRAGLLRVGHPLNPSGSTDEGFFGSPRQGVYVSRYVEYALQYSNPHVVGPGGQTAPVPVAEGSVVRILMLKVLPGRSLQIAHLAPGIGPTPGYDSHSSPSFLEWFLFDETQACPTHVLEITALVNARTTANDGLC
eukprot:m51a1_g11198 hypothetical protein (1070) ;mRNA; r:7771-10980